jgi:hypothetical protein
MNEHANSSETSRFTKDLESQTKVMAGGHIAAPDPPSDALFELTNMIRESHAAVRFIAQIVRRSDVAK